MGHLPYIPTPKESPSWLRIFADHIAVALVNARAFEENERLKAQLELENTYLREEVREAGPSATSSAKAWSCGI